MGEMPKDPIDDLVRRSMKDAPGAPSSFRSRINAQIAAEQQQAKRARVIRIQAAAAVAAVLVLALVIGLNIDLFLPADKPDQPPQARADKDEHPVENTGGEAPEQPAPQPEPKEQPEKQPQPQPEEQPEIPDQVEQPEPKPEDQPDPPPGPEPEPKPEETVEKPDPKPEPKPEDVVEQPEPTETGPTESPGKRRYFDMGQLLASSGEVEWRVSAGEWQELPPGSKVQTGWQLRAGRDPVDIQLDNGGLIRFDGELEIDELEQDNAYVFRLKDDGLYVDTLGTNRNVFVTVNELQAEMGAGAGLFELDRGGLNAASIHGSIKLGDETVSEGKQRRLTDRGVQGEKDFRGDRLLDDLPARVLARYDFIEAPPGGMYEDGERIEDGVVVMDKNPRYIAFRHDQTLEVLPGTVVRFRIRATKVTRLDLEQFTPDNAILFNVNWTPEDDDWHVVEFRLHEIEEKDNPQRKILTGDLLRNFKLHYIGDKLELDWVEYVRVQS